jgi:uncharacterized protein YjbJ (UPF0337 family)
MGMDDKIKNAAQDLTGKAKEGVGKATDNERLEAEGERDQAAANMKQAGENVKDAFRSRFAGVDVRGGRNLRVPAASACAAGGSEEIRIDQQRPPDVAQRVDEAVHPAPAER